MKTTGALFRSHQEAYGLGAECASAYADVYWSITDNLPELTDGARLGQEFTMPKALQPLFNQRGKSNAISASKKCLSIEKLEKAINILLQTGQKLPFRAEFKTWKDLQDQAMHCLSKKLAKMQK